MVQLSFFFFNLFAAGGQAIIIIRPILGVLVGIVATLVTAAIALILFMKYKHQKGSKGETNIKCLRAIFSYSRIFAVPMF